MTTETFSLADGVAVTARAGSRAAAYLARMTGGRGAPGEPAATACADCSCGECEPDAGCCPVGDCCDRGGTSDA